jgi:hypothetical protein
LCERASHQSVILDKFTVVAHETEEVPQHLHCGGTWSYLDDLHLGWVHGHHTVGDDVAEVVDGGGTEGSLDLLHDQLVVAQDLEDEPNMLQMLGPCVAIYENVIKIQAQIDGGRLIARRS